MNKSCLTGMAAWLLGAGVSLAQGPDTLPAPRPLTAPEPPAAWQTCAGMPPSPGFDEATPRAGAAILTAGAQYMVWFFANPHDNVPLATTDFFGRSDTFVLGNIGDAEQDRRTASGGRFSLGYWQIEGNPYIPGGIRDLGAEATFFFIAQRSVDLTNDTSTTIIRPFLDVNDNRESGFIVAAPGVASGNIVAHAQAEVWGAEANVWKNVYYDCPGTTHSTSLMVGFRYLDYDARLNIDSVSLYNPDPNIAPAFLSLAGSTVHVSDSFTAHNHFYGGQIGAMGRCWLGDSKASIEVAFKLGLGATTEDLNIAGSQVRTLPSGTQITSTGGLLALPSNIGNQSLTKFAQVPEADFKLSCPLGCHVTLSTGFSALYWSRILRPTQQIDRDLDISQIPNFPPGVLAVPTSLGVPAAPLHQSDLVLLGISFGVEVNW
jgi:hypothetical protein